MYVVATDVPNRSCDALFCFFFAKEVIGNESGDGFNLFSFFVLSAQKKLSLSLL